MEKKKISNLSIGIIFLEFKHSWNSSFRDDWAYNYSLSSIGSQSFFRAKPGGGIVHKLFPPHDFGKPSSSFLLSSLPFSHPRKAVDELKADGIDLEALGTPEVTQSNGMKPGSRRGQRDFFFYYRSCSLTSHPSLSIHPSRFLSAFENTQERKTAPKKKGTISSIPTTAIAHHFICVLRIKYTMPVTEKKVYKVGPSMARPRKKPP